MTTHTPIDEYLSTFDVAKRTGMCPRSISRICRRNAAALQESTDGFLPDLYRIPKREGSSSKFGGDVRVRYSAFARVLARKLTDVTTGPSGEGCWDALVSAMQRPTRIVGPMDPVPPEVLKAALSLYGSEHRAA